MQAIARMQHRAMVPRAPKRFVHPQSTANKKIYASRQYVKKVVKGLSELKFHVDPFDTTAIDHTVPIVTQLSDIAQGDTNSTRDGDMIDPVSLEIRYQVRPQNASISAVVRIIVFQWQADGTDNPPIVADILQETALIRAVNSPHKNGGSRKLFRVLYDRRHSLTTSNAGNLEEQLGFVRITAKRLARIYWEDVADKKGHLYLLATSNLATASSPPELRFVSELKFKDI